LLPRPPPRSTLFPYTTLFRSGPSRYGDHAMQYRPQVCGVAEADGYFEFLLRPLPVCCGGLETGLARSGEFHAACAAIGPGPDFRSEEHTSELQSPYDLVCRLL